MIHVTDLKKAYGSTLAPAGLSFHLQPRQCFGATDLVELKAYDADPTSAQETAHA